MPASVRSKPEPSLSAIRSAIGVFPGRMIVAGRVSYQRSQPAFARWKIRCGPGAPASDGVAPGTVVDRSRNLPWRAAPVTSAPLRASTGGSYVFSAAMFATETRVMVRPVTRSRRKSTRPCTSGISGMTSSSHARPTRGQSPSTAQGCGVRSSVASRPAIQPSSRPRLPTSPATEQALVAEPEGACGTGGRNVAGDGTPSDAVEPPAAGREAPVDHRACRLGDDSPTAGVGDHPEADLGGAVVLPQAAQSSPRAGHRPGPPRCTRSPFASARRRAV